MPDPLLHPAARVLGRRAGHLVARGLDHLLRYEPFRRYVTAIVTPLPPSRLSVPDTFRLTFRESLTVAKAFVPRAFIDPPPENMGVTQQFILFTVTRDGKKERQRRAVVPVLDEQQEYELPVHLKVGDRISGGFRYADAAGNQSDPFAFDITLAEDIDVTPPETPTAFSLGLRSVEIPDEEPAPDGGTGGPGGEPGAGTPGGGAGEPVVEPVTPPGETGGGEPAAPPGDTGGAPAPAPGGTDVGGPDATGGTGAPDAGAPGGTDTTGAPGGTDTGPAPGTDATGGTAPPPAP